MANKAKMTAQYFPHYAAQKKTVPILKAKFGSHGYACWYQLLEMLCAANGHFLDCSAPGDVDFMAAEMGIPVETIELILRELLFRRKIDRELWEADRIIWCQGLVDNLKNTLYIKRIDKPVKPIPSRNCPIPGNQFEFRTGNAIDSTEKTGREVKRSKENRSKENSNQIPVPEMPSPSKINLAELWSKITGKRTPGMNTERQRRSNARISETPNGIEPYEYWKGIIIKIKESKFCQGENDRGWIATFDWLLQPDTHLKVDDGKYDNRNKTTQKTKYDENMDVIKRSIEKENENYGNQGDDHKMLGDAGDRISGTQDHGGIYNTETNISSGHSQRSIDDVDEGVFDEMSFFPDNSGDPGES